jgi:hypothetical protein
MADNQTKAQLIKIIFRSNAVFIFLQWYQKPSHKYPQRREDEEKAGQNASRKGQTAERSGRWWRVVFQSAA